MALSYRPRCHFNFSDCNHFVTGAIHVTNMSRFALSSVVPGILMILLAMVAIGGLPADTAPGKARLFVHVKGLRNTEGIAGALLFRSGAGFPDTKDRAYRMSGARITGDSATILFQGLPPGDYAVSVIHDENENHTMDKNMLRMPAEGFGFSNNPATGLRLPEFQESSFHFDGNTDRHIYINIRYL